MNYNPFANLPTGVVALIAVFAIYTIIVKGLALYRAGSLRDKPWFIAMLLLNTAGILELTYLLVISKRRTRI